MPVAIRKRSWEEHVTHPSGLQYSYDDLDLVCFHGVDSQGPWMGAGVSKPGRQTRCASMPEGCHQLPTDDLVQTLKAAASVGNGKSKSENNEKVSLDLQMESVHIPLNMVDVNVSQRTYESEHLQTADIVDFQEINSDSVFLCTRISCASSNSDKTINREGEVGTENTQSHDICSEGNAFKSPHIAHEVQQCISISSHNRLPLSESAGEQPGKIPDHPETKESHTEGYIRPPEISEATLNSSSSVELEPQLDIPQDEDEKDLPSDHTGANVLLLVGVLHSSAMEAGDMMSLESNTVEAVVALDEGRDSGVTENGSTDFSDKLDGLNYLETLNEKISQDQSRDIQGGIEGDCTLVIDQVYGGGMMCPTLLEQPHFETTGLTRPQGGETTVVEHNKKSADARYASTTSSDICFKGQCCNIPVSSNMLSVQVETGNSEKEPTQAKTEYVKRKTTLIQPMEDTDQSSPTKNLASGKDQNIAQQLEIGSLKLDNIHEAEPCENTKLDPERITAPVRTQNPAVQHSCMKDTPACPAKVKAELSPEVLHGNQACGHYLHESPVSEVADGQREHHRMEDTDEAVLHASNKSGELKKDNSVKLRMRKVRLRFRSYR